MSQLKVWLTDLTLTPSLPCLKGLGWPQAHVGSTARDSAIKVREEQSAGKAQSMIKVGDRLAHLAHRLSAGSFLVH